MNEANDSGWSFISNGPKVKIEFCDGVWGNNKNILPLARRLVATSDEKELVMRREQRKRTQNIKNDTGIYRERGSSSTK